MTVRLCGDLFDYCKTYGQVVERFEVISLFNLVDDMHSEVCKFTIREGIPIDKIQCNYVTNLIVLRNEGREYTCLVRGTFSDDITRFLRTYGSKFELPDRLPERLSDVQYGRGPGGLPYVRLGCRGERVGARDSFGLRL